MKIMIRTREICPDGAEGSAVLAITHERIDYLRRMVNLFRFAKQQEATVAYLESHGSPLQVYELFDAHSLHDDGLIGDDALEQWKDRLWCILPDDFDPVEWDVEFGVRTDSERLVAGERDGEPCVYWTWRQKNSDYETESEWISFSMLEALLAAAT